MAYYLAPVSNGLGDLIVTIPILHALIKSGHETYLIMRSPAQYGLSDKIEGLAGSIKESEFKPEELKAGDRYFNFRDHPLQSSSIWGSKEFNDLYPGYKILDVLKGICRDFQIDCDFSLQPLSFHKRQDLSQTVIFIPGSAGHFKCWPEKHWLTLAQLLEEQGIPVLVIGEPERCQIVANVIEAGLPHEPTPVIGDALDLISSAKAVVAVDTGLMHLSVHQGVPTVSIFRYNNMFMRPYKHVRSLVGPVCPAVCLEREFADSPNEKLAYPVWQLWEPLTCALEDEKERCLYGITPQAVFNELKELLS